MKATQVVTIKNKLPLYKGNEEAHSIELIQFEENAFEVISQKGLYEIGDKAVYIQPDYCLSDIPLFDTFLESKKLGSNNRIKAIKFSFTTEKDVIGKTYSNGILLPKLEVEKYICESKRYLTFILYGIEENLDELLGITKYEEPERNSGGINSGLSKGDLPQGMYKTDETNIKNIVSRITFPIELIGSLKVDGSSCTIYYKDEDNYGICSRNQEKKLDQRQVVGYEGFRKHFNMETKERGWISIVELPEPFGMNTIFLSNEKIEELTKEFPGLYVPIYDELQDDFIKLGKPILDKLVEYCKENNKSLALRGEIAGSNLKGSGNKNNPHSKLQPCFYLFGIDDYSTGVTVPVDFQNYVEIGLDLDVTSVDILFKETFNSYDEIKEKCQDYFSKNLVEGIVLRNLDSKFSVKFMNDEYDEKK